MKRNTAVRRRNRSTTAPSSKTAARAKAVGPSGDIEALLRSTLDALSAHIAVLDRTGTIISVNQAWRSFARATGFIGRDDGVGMNYLKVCERSAPASREAAQTAAALRDIIGGRRLEFRIEYACESQDGLHWFQMRVTRQSAKRISRIVVAHEDITEVKQAQAEAEQRRNELTHLTRVAILGEFSGTLAHELNQPLTAILSNAQTAQRLLAKDPVALDEVHEILSDISDDSRRAGEVVTRLRTLMKKGEVKRVQVNLNDLAIEVLELTHSELVERNVAVTTRLTPGLPDIPGDRVQLQQVLLNLIMNACEAMRDIDSRDRSLVVSTAHDGDNNLRLIVADCGPGVSSDLIDRIFEPFVTTKAKGLGLGLSICRSIVASHHGRLWVVNNVDRGASFFVSLPIDVGGHA